MIRGRLTRIGDRDRSAPDYQNPRAQRLAEREFNLSFADAPQADNEVVAGPGGGTPGTQEPQFSVEEGLAETLGIGLGDRLTFWVSGHEVAAPVTSLRQVHWDSFNVNFFVVAPPGPARPGARHLRHQLPLPPESETADPRPAPAPSPASPCSTWTPCSARCGGSWSGGSSAVEYVFLVHPRRRAAGDVRRASRPASRSGAPSMPSCAPWGPAAATCCAAWRWSSRSRGCWPGCSASLFAEAHRLAAGGPGLRADLPVQPEALARGGPGLRAPHRPGRDPGHLPAAGAAAAPDPEAGRLTGLRSVQPDRHLVPNGAGLRIPPKPRHGSAMIPTSIRPQVSL